MAGNGVGMAVLGGALGAGIASLVLSGSPTAAITCGALGAVAALVVSLATGEKNRPSTIADGAAAASQVWDVIIVGGGTAGCVLANRLSKAKSGKGMRVLVLEAGRSDYDSPLITIPAGILRLFKSKFDWDFQSASEPATSGRSIFLPRGKVLGGSSCMNLTLYHRGDAQDYDIWETKFGCKGWKASDVLPHFKRTEDDHIGLATKDPKHHGSGGEWGTDNVRYQNPLSKAFLEACNQMGLKRNEDFNNWDKGQEGAGRFAVSQRNGARTSAATAMLEPAAADSGRQLRVLTNAPARRVLFSDDKTATGVHFTAGEVDHVARLAPGGEVLLCGGAIHSPQLLMLSGIGPAAHLKEHGIAVVQDLPGVGCNLQDHPGAVVSFECPPEQKGVSVTSKLRIAGTLVPHPGPLLQWYLTGSGPLTSTGCDHGGFFRTPAAHSSSPDLQMRFLPARAVSADGMGTFTNFRKTRQHPDGFSFQSVACRALSKGRVMLSSADPAAKPVITTNYLTDKGDVATIREGLKMARKLAQQPAFKDYLGKEVFPGPHVQSDAQLDSYIADTVHSTNALVGTCRMGKEDDAEAVCDPDMRVKGVKGLRICDASLMPRIPGGQTGACVVMMAERCADMLLGR